MALTSRDVARMITEGSDYNDDDSIPADTQPTSSTSITWSEIKDTCKDTIPSPILFSGPPQGALLSSGGPLNGKQCCIFSSTNY